MSLIGEGKSFDYRETQSEDVVAFTLLSQNLIKYEFCLPSMGENFNPLLYNLERIFFTKLRV